MPFALALIVSTPVFGGGLYISEFGQPGMGLSGAGWNVLAEDASTGVASRQVSSGWRTIASGW